MSPPDGFRMSPDRPDLANALEDLHLDALALLHQRERIERQTVQRRRLLRQQRAAQPSTQVSQR